jgi:hypothetical protein
MRDLNASVQANEIKKENIQGQSQKMAQIQQFSGFCHEKKPHSIRYERYGTVPRTSTSTRTDIKVLNPCRMWIQT